MTLRPPPARRKATDEHIALIRRCVELRKQIPTLRQLADITGLSESTVRHISCGDVIYKSSAHCVQTNGE